MKYVFKTKITSPTIIQKSISEKKYKHLLTMGKKWLKFKKFRKNKKFDVIQGDGWLTMLERESMLDSIFDILFYEKEDLKET